MCDTIFDTINVNVFPAPAIAVTPSNANVCGGIGASLTASGGNSYTWTPSFGLSQTIGSTIRANPSTTTTYSVTGVDVNGCSAIATATINIVNGFSLTISGTTTICSGASGTISATPNGGTGPYTYTWQPGGLNGSSININPTSTTVYSVSASDANGCTSGTFTHSVTISSGNPIQANINGTTGVCSGGTAVLTASAVGGTGSFNFLWSQGSTGNTISTSPTTSITYSVYASDVCGNSDTLDFLLNVYDPPQINYTLSDSEGCAPVCINFTNTTPNTNNITWYFGDGDSSVTFNPQHCYHQAGSYNLNIVLTDGNGCSSSISHLNRINVYPKPQAGFTAYPNPATILTSPLQFIDTSIGGC